MSRIQQATEVKTPVATRLATGELVPDNTGVEEARLFEVVGLERSSYHHMPSVKVRQESNGLEQILMMVHSDRVCDELVLVMDHIYEECARILLPSDAKWLQDQHYLKLSKSRGLPVDQKKRVKILEGFAKGLFVLVKKMPRHTMAHQIARAIIVDNATDAELANIFSHLSPPTFCKIARKRGHEDMTGAIESGKEPEKKRRSVARIDTETLTRMVKHILSFSQALSWGTKELRQKGKTATITFPRLTRTHPVKGMFMDYARKEAELQGIELDKNQQSPQRTTYYLLVKHLTSKAEKSITCIDYVQDILVNVRVTGLVVIIEQVIAPTQHKTMKRYVLILQNFLKYQYDGHLQKGSAICSHSIHYGLGLEPQSNTGNTESTSVQIQGVEHCPACKFVEYFMRIVLPDAVKANRSSANSRSIDDALDYIEDSLDCFHRYQAHHVRVVNQQKAIQEVDLKLKDEVLRSKQRGTTAKITMDFKQKFVEKRLRSSQMNDFGQRGNSWHIGVIEYYDYEAPCQANSSKARAVPMMFPIDQILDTGNKQDGPCVLSMLEAMMKMVNVQFGFVKRIVLASDNANCYHSKDLIFPICFINQLSSSPRIVKYIHPETQDGKGSCDSHAAVAGTHVDRHYICTRKDDTLTKNEACTPTELANALCTNGGIKNSSVQLIALDFPRLDKISQLCSGAGEAAKEYFARANEIRFFPELDELADWSRLDLKNESTWSAAQPLIQVINYSGISDGMVFRAGFSGWQNGKGTFTPVVAPSDDPEWHVRMEASIMGLNAIQRAKEYIDISEVGQSVIARLNAHVQAAKVGKAVIMSQVVSEIITGKNKTNNNEDVQHGAGLLENLMDDDDDDVSESDCFESFYGEIEHTTAYVDECQQDDTAFFSDVEDGDIGCSAGVDEEAANSKAMAGDANGTITATSQLLDKAPREHYEKTTFFTRVEVIRYKPFRTFQPTKQRATKDQKTKKSVEEDEEAGKGHESRRVEDRAIGLALHYINSPECSITPALNDNMKEYKVANHWRPRETLMRDQGWARRPLSGGLYGRNYMNDEFKKIGIAQFNRGLVNKGDKQSPTQTLALMKEEHQGFYCYPGLHEIVRMFSGLVQQSKQNGNKIISFQKKSGPLVSPEIKAELQSILDKKPDYTPAPLVDAWKKAFAANREYDEEKVRKQATRLRAKLMIDMKKRLKRSMAG
ncbi:unnamed protein product [Cylindrotheca closterium]|uniref:Uncharacterized protein n=1 Tax=Cylindrotheca closterium TaxID=2856 RepID=A0AAD2GAZ4_9STRA|nr:unnamed protein product [Cylindrotheca closterium]